MTACDSCLRRAYLVAFLAPRIAGLLDSPRRRTRALLALPDQELVAAVGRPEDPGAEDFLERFEPREARSELEDAAVVAICRHESDYPSGLRELPDAPPVIFSVGRSRRLRELEETPAVTLVGARRASPYGLEVAYALGRGAAAAGVPVISGLALGVDASAHRGCVHAGGLPVAVLAGGPDVASPRRNARLYRRVRELGIVISEAPPGRRALRWSFPARNRLMAGLGALTIVVEAADPSGSLISAEFAQDLGRAVGAVPGRITSRMSAGSNGLLRDGACVITSPQDLLDELFGPGARQLGSEADPLPGDPRLRPLLEAIEGGADPHTAGGEAGLSAAEVRAGLARLETDGWIVRVGLAGFERAAHPRSRGVSR
ncbi:MAG: DNA-processing protein DprA [Thermoleophilaceae bacterium]